MQTNSETQAKGGFGATLASDLPASLVVFLIAVPLSLGIALASGAPLMAGIIAAIVGGIVVGCLGGSPLQASGPAAGLTVLVYGIVQQYGWGVTCAITVAAGILQVIFGAMGAAPAALAMPPSVIHGMLAAIGILIAFSQAHVVLGSEPQGKGLKNILALPESVMGMNATSLAVGLLTIGILVAWLYVPKKVRAVPGALLAVVVATLIAVIFKLDVPRVELGGNLFQSIKLPIFPTDNLVGPIVAALTIAFVASAESLLCAVATDKLHTGPRANLHKELVAQGVGNTVSGLLGGLPITGVVVRSTANINAGAKTRLSTILHGVWVLLIITLAPGLVGMVPLAALAGLLVFTGFRLVDKNHIKELYQRGEIWIYAITVAAIIATDLLTGLGVGFAAAIVRLLWKLTHAEVRAVKEGNRWMVTIDGTLTFAGVPKLTRVLSAIPPGADVDVDLNVRFIDHAGYEALHSWQSTFEKIGGKVRMDQLEEIWSRTNGRDRTAVKPVAPELAPAEATG